MVQALLGLAAELGLDLPVQRLHDAPPVAGMFSSDRMDALAAASGAEFPRLWLEGMIYRHQCPIDMSHVRQRRQLASARRPYGLGVLAEEAVVEQRAEITGIRAWLDAWGSQARPRPSDSRNPARYASMNLPPL